MILYKEADMKFVINDTKDYLLEMSKPIQDVKQLLHDSEEQRILNLMQIFIIRGNTINHWINELYGCCNRTYKLKSNNRFLGKKSLENILWFEWEDCFYNWLPGYLFLVAKKEGKTELPEFDEERLYQFMKDYHLWLAEQLSAKGQVSLKEVKDKIYSLI